MRETLTSLYDLRRSVGRNLSSKQRKLIYSTRATRGYVENSSKEVGKSKVSFKKCLRDFLEFFIRSKR